MWSMASTFRSFDNQRYINTKIAHFRVLLRYTKSNIAKGSRMKRFGNAMLAHVNIAGKQVNLLLLKGQQTIS